jgi:methyl-accepting chemotaxis protein WspA
MFHNLSIRNKLILGFGAIVAIILSLLIFANDQFARLQTANRWDRHTLEVLLETNHVASSVLQVQSATRGYILTGNETLVTPVQAEYASAREHLRRAIEITVDNPVQQSRLRQLESLLTSWMDNAITPQIVRRRQGVSGAGAPGTTEAVIGGTTRVAAMRQILNDIEADEDLLLKRRSTETAALRQTMNQLLSGGGAACVVLALLIATLLVRAISRPLESLMRATGQIAGGTHGARADVMSRDELGQVALEFNRMAQAIEDSQAKELAATNELRAKVDTLLLVVSRAARGDLTGTVGGIGVQGEDAIGRLGAGIETMLGNLRSLLTNVQRAGIQVTTSATQIAASARQQEATGIEQAQTSVEVLATTREISANTAQLLRTMEEATDVADHTASAAADAQDNLKRMDQSMQQMVTATDQIGAKLAALSEKASNINGVLTTITKVADQTNILSLNAAIEAEKAGEAGRGFSVVASEIRRLADQTSVSTWDIEQMLKEMQSAVSASVMGVDKFAEEIRRSVGEARHVAEQLSSMMDRIHQLAPRFDLVLQGMQSQAVGASQISTTMTQLSDTSQQTVDSLKATSEAVHQLQYAAGDLQQSVATFSVHG